MATLAKGTTAPDFNLPRDGGNMLGLKDFSGRYLVLYFYPRDDTPGCTKEAIGFTEKQAAFQALNADVLGVSRDTVAKHEKFISKHGLKIPLGADIDGKVTQDYGVWVEKNMYGKKYMGIERATFLIDPQGKIIEIWRKVRVKNHVETVLDTLEAHQA